MRSEEDENRFRNLIYLVEHSNECKGTKEGFIKFINRFKSLKNRVQPQPNQEWSEEDEHWRQKAIDFMKHPDLIKATPTLAKNTVVWLKALKERYTWKPTDEQLQFLLNYAEQNNYDGSVLTSLYKDLKKLNEH